MTVSSGASSIPATDIHTGVHHRYTDAVDAEFLGKAQRRVVDLRGPVPEHHGEEDS